jgi:AcrR family transcriptional regulator
VAITVRARISEAAVALFSEKGFDATSVQEIVERAEVTKGAMYHYYRSKDDLLYEIYHDLLTRQLSDLDRILAAGLTLADTIRSIVVDLVETTADCLKQTVIFARDTHRLSGERMASLRADRRRYHEAVRDLISRGQDEAVFARTASPDTVTLMLFGIVNQLPQWYRPPGPGARGRSEASQARGREPKELLTPRELATEIADFILAGLHTEEAFHGARVPHVPAV